MTAAGDTKPFQFTLWHLAVATFWLCVALGLIVQLQWLGLILVFLLTCGLMVYGGRQEAGVLLFITGLLLICLFLNLNPPRKSTARMSCLNNMKQIALALQQYHVRHGSFPPAFTIDKNGRPMHSWRALILPEIKPDLAGAYRYDEPWDGPNNIQLANFDIALCRCPACSKKQPPGEVSYLAVVGPGTLWPGTQSASIDDVKDGAADTILIVEVHNSGIRWSEPRDLHLSQMPMTINARRGVGISSLHSGGAVVAFADGSVRFLDDDLSPETLRALLTTAGGESITRP